MRSSISISEVGVTLAHDVAVEGGAVVRDGDGARHVLAHLGGSAGIRARRPGRGGSGHKGEAQSAVDDLHRGISGIYYNETQLALYSMLSSPAVAARAPGGVALSLRSLKRRRLAQPLVPPDL